MIPDMYMEYMYTAVHVYGHSPWGTSHPLIQSAFLNMVTLI